MIFERLVTYNNGEIEKALNFLDIIISVGYEPNFVSYN